MTSCELNQIFVGEVAAIQNYGAFVRIPGCRQQGLIHKSQVSSSRIDDVTDVLQRGDRVWCKIISVGDDGKIGLSMKVVNQGNGTDLDPNGVEVQRDEQKRKKFGTSQKKIIELEAVLNTTCIKCGTKGHFATDCFVAPDGKKYDLLPEIEHELVPIPPTSELSPPGSEPQSSKDEKKISKKSKKRKKSKKSRHRSASSTDDSSSEDERKKKKKKKKHTKEVKRKKRKYSESSSDGSSDSVIREKHAKKCKHSKSKHSD